MSNIEDQLTHDQLTRRLKEYEKQWGDMDYTIGKCLQENQELKQQVAKLESALSHARMVQDDPECDGTDAAHPAWWRGNDVGAISCSMIMEEAIDGKDQGHGVIGNENLERTRRKILALNQRVSEMHKALELCKTMLQNAEFAKHSGHYLILEYRRDEALHAIEEINKTKTS